MEKQKYNFLGVNILPEYIWPDFQAENKKEAIEKMATNLFEKGVVKREYIQAVLDREEEFSTGLEFDDIGIAIPHTDAEFVNEPAVSVSLLSVPVVFGSMETSDKEIPVQLIFMLAIKDPTAQLRFLQGLIGVFQDSQKLHTLSSKGSKEEILNYLTELLQEEELS